jgi:hypothetical protein
LGAGAALDYQQWYQSVSCHDDQNGLYLPDISKTLDEKNGTRGGVVAATDYSGGSPLVMSSSVYE